MIPCPWSAMLPRNIFTFAIDNMAYTVEIINKLIFQSQTRHNIDRLSNAFLYYEHSTSSFISLNI